MLQNILDPPPPCSCNLVQNTLIRLAVVVELHPPPSPPPCSIAVTVNNSQLDKSVSLQLQFNLEPLVLVLYVGTFSNYCLVQGLSPPCSSSLDIQFG